MSDAGDNAKTSDEDETAGGAVTLARPEEESLRLKTLAEENHASGNLKSALKYAKRALKLHPSLDGLPEILAALKILRSAAAEGSSSTQNATPDYYKILQVERFSHINTIKKQYKKLALTLHPDKNPSAAAEEAFKLVGEAMGVLSDKIRRKEYDMKIRVSMQAVASEEAELGAEGGVLTFWTSCSACRLLHQFERKYLGHNLMCPSCKKSFKAMEVEEETSNVEDGGIGEGKTRVSARIRERATKGENLGIVEKCGLGVKRKIGSVAEVLERPEKKVARKTGGDGGLLKDLKSKRVENIGAVKEIKSARVGGAKGSKSGGVETVESERSKRAKAREEETMTLSQMKILVKKKKKPFEGRLMMKENEVDVEKVKGKEREGDNREEENEREDDMEKEEEDEREEERENEKEMEEEEEEREEVTDEEKETMNLREWKNRARLSKDRKVKVVERTSKKGSLEVLMSEKEQSEDGQENEREVVVTREKRVRRRVSKYGNSEAVKKKTSKTRVESEIEKLITKRKGNLEIMSVEDSDFHDFDRDRRERSFKKGQVWALYDDSDGMPRQYALIDQIVSINPFEVKLSWLQFQSNGENELTNRRRTGSHVSCGRFTVSGEVSVKYLNLFSHAVDCERAAREVYRVYPKKGSVWALYNSENTYKPCYDIVISLSSYSDVHGVSIAYLEKVPGFRTVFKRKGIGANFVICLGNDDVKLFSHQIPAKKLSGEEGLGITKDCWELDPASINL
ncbi:hypothetical protein ACP275_05G116200 [Erythranthe tilingii]